jgi:hypothetical protein
MTRVDRPVLMSTFSCRFKRCVPPGLMASLDRTLHQSWTLAALGRKRTFATLSLNQD